MRNLNRFMAVPMADILQTRNAIINRGSSCLIRNYENHNPYDC